MSTTNEKKKSKWKFFAVPVMMLQFALSVAAVGVVIWLNVLPDLYLALFGLILLFLFTMVYLLFFTGGKEKTQEKNSIVYEKNDRDTAFSGVYGGVCARLLYDGKGGRHTA